MMRALRINFQADDGPRLLCNEEVSNHTALLQAALATVATATGSDPISPTRGTALLRTTSMAAATTADSLQYACSFAALQVLFNSREQRRQEDDLRLETLTLTPVSVDTWNARTRIEVAGTFNDGATFGDAANL